MPDTDPFTHAQQEAVKKAYGIISEHFHDALIVVAAKHDAPDDAPANQTSETTRLYYVGSHKEALANVIYANHYLLAGLHSQHPE